MMWIALLRGRVKASLAATRGVESAAEVVKYLLAGADAVMTTSALLRHGPVGLLPPLARVAARNPDRFLRAQLLALRVGVVALIVSAFARPLLDRLGAGGGAFATGREVVVLLDDSYSMRYGDRWERAVAAAGRAVDGLGPNDRATIVLFDARARALGQATGDRAALHAELAGARPGFGTTRYAAGLELARDMVLHSTLPRREVVLISDFQRSGGRADERAALPSGTAVHAIDVSGGVKGDNVAVVGALVERSTRGNRDQATVTARVANHGGRPARSVAIELVADGRTTQTLHMDIAAGADRTVTFQPLPVANRSVRVIVRTAGDGLAADDAYHLVIAPGDVLHGTVVGAPGGRA